MRISDWSSDVCSSDLVLGHEREGSADVVHRDCYQPPGRALAHLARRVDVVPTDRQLVGVVLRSDQDHGPAGRLRPYLLAQPVETRFLAVDCGETERHVHAQVGLAGPSLRDQEMAFAGRSEEHTSELQSLMRISYAVFCL